MIEVGDRVEVINVGPNPTDFVYAHAGRRGTVTRRETLTDHPKTIYAWVRLDDEPIEQAFYLVDLKVLDPIDSLGGLA